MTRPHPAAPRRVRWTTPEVPAGILALDATVGGVELRLTCRREPDGTWTPWEVVAEWGPWVCRRRLWPEATARQAKCAATAFARRVAGGGRG